MQASDDSLREAVSASIGAIMAGPALAPWVLSALFNHRAVTAEAAGGTVFVFPGHGARWAEMAIELANSAPAFADQMRACDAAFSEFVDWSLLEMIHGDAPLPQPDPFDVSQHVSFAVMVSLAAQWKALGIHPDAVIGQAHGEIAAAYVAEALDLQDAVNVVTQHAAAISTIARTAGTVRISWPEERLDYATHSGQIDELRPALRKSLARLHPRSTDITFISSVTGAGLDTSILDGDYWLANLRQPVLLEQAVRWACGHGYHTFIEASPDPVLLAGIREMLDEPDDTHATDGRPDSRGPGLLSG